MAATGGPPVPHVPGGRIADQLRSDPVADLALSLEFDVERIFRFVADEIRYEPYPGILRGAQGTLKARAGNSADQALLLAALLDASLVPYRFAQGALDVAAAAQLLATLPVDVDEARRLARDPLDAGVEQVASRDAPSPSPPLVAEYEEQEATLTTEAQERLEVAADRLHETAAMLQAALADAGISVPAQDALPPAEVNEHIWVQAAFGPEWRDLDPTLPGAVAGGALTVPSETLERLPDDLRYRVRFDVVVERVEGGALVTDGLLEDEEFADQLAGMPVSFGHVSPSGLKDLGVTMGSLFGDGWLEYRPTLDFGARAVVADDTVAFPMGDGSSDIFSTGLEPSAGGGAPVEGEATAEWLEVSVTPPGGETVVARRTIFDRIPPGLREGGTPPVEAVTPITLVDLDGTGSAGYPPMEGVETFAVATGPTSVAPLLASGDDGLGRLALAYHYLRDVMGSSIVLDAGARTFLDSPNIVSVSVRFDPEATARDPASGARFGFDIWHRSHGTLALTHDAITSGDARIMAGISDHLAERFALEFASDTPLGTRSTVGVGHLFEAAAAQGIPTLVIHGDVPSDLGFGPDAIASIQRLARAGNVVVVPAEPVTIGDSTRVGWWAVDPSTGATTDTMDDGSASEFAEYGFVVRTRIGLVRCYGALAATVAGYLAAATSALTVMNIMSDFAPGAGAAAVCAAL
jgi:transglutaminase-like putative cysteine protease